MKKLATLTLAAAFLLGIGCAAKPVHKNWEAISGSRADATVEVGYLYNPNREAPQHSEQQAHDEALKRCRAWGYASAEPFGMARYQCQQFMNDPFLGSGCISMLVSRQFQCLGHGDAYVPREGEHMKPNK